MSISPSTNVRGFTYVPVTASPPITPRTTRRTTAHRAFRNLSPVSPGGAAALSSSRKSVLSNLRNCSGMLGASIMLATNMIIVCLTVMYVNTKGQESSSASKSLDTKRSYPPSVDHQSSILNASTFHSTSQFSDGVSHEQSASSTDSGVPSAVRSRLTWDHTSGTSHDFCQNIIDYPQPHRKNCSVPSGEVSKELNPETGTPVCDPSRPMMFAQYGEDYFLYTRHFKHMKTPGVYLDVATNHPIAISNTYFMDRCLGWSGICIEANSKYFELIHRERSCALVPTCVSAREGETVEFALSGPGSGIISTHRQGSQIMDNAKLVERKKCVTIRTQLERYGVNVIDYFNLDVEGGELNVLKSIDWNHTIIKIISVEISGSSEQPIHLFLTQLGFVKIDNELPVNDLPGMPIYRTNKFYAHSSVQFGRP